MGIERMLSPDFQGRRLSELRIAAMLSKRELAGQIGRTPQAVSQYEKGVTAPSGEVVDRLATFFGVHRRFFFTIPPHGGQDLIVHFDSHAASAKRAREALNVKIAWLGERIDALDRMLGGSVPEVSLPPCVAPDDPADISHETIDEAAALLREKWGLGSAPIGPLTAECERNGIFVFRFGLGSDKLQSASCVWGKRPVAVVSSSVSSGARIRFCLARELGCLLLHQNVAREHLTDSKSLKLMEEQSRRFASRFLLPEGGFREPGGGERLLDYCLAAKAEWIVPMDVILRKLEADGTIDADEYRRARVSMSKRKWTKTEPMDDTIPIEQPSLFRKAHAAVEKGLSLSPDELENAAPLPDSFLREVLSP